MNKTGLGNSAKLSMNENNSSNHGVSIQLVSNNYLRMKDILKFSTITNSLKISYKKIKKLTL